MVEWRNKRVLITGASSGIGAEFARQLARESAILVLIARRKSLLEELKIELLALGAKEVELIVADLTNDQDLQSIINRINAQPIDLLINNAGRGSFGYFENLDINEELSQIKLNVVATVAIAHAAIKGMKSRHSGAVISVSSVAAFQPLPFMATYAATKSFNFTHSLALREELKPFGIKVLILCPGPTATEFGGVARVPGTISGVVRDQVSDVVTSALKGLRAGKAFITPGVRSGGLSLLSRFLPKVLTTKIVGKGLLKTLIAAQNK